MNDALSTTRSTPQRVTRLAPSPTGALHLGNARTFLINWAVARQRGWRIVFRIEDLDSPRVKAGAAEQAVDDLHWLGLDWDTPTFTQLADLSPYETALSDLRERGLIYPCTCTRKEIEAAQSAPHDSDHELRYPGTCRPPKEVDGSGASTAIRGTDSDDGAAWRVIVDGEPIMFDDQVAGPQSFDLDALTGDFVVATKQGLPAYQLAVVTDDARQGVTDVVRGDDLLNSAARQLHLYRMLDLGATSPLPTYWHLPLVVGPDGRRLAKRHGDTRIAWYREQGVPAERITALLARWSGVDGARANAAACDTMTAAMFRDQFDITALPREPITFTEEDHQWLLRG